MRRFMVLDAIAPERMNQGSLFTGQPVLSQMLSLIPKSLVAELVAEHRADRYCKTLYSYDHLVTMLYNAYGQCDSLRGVISGMQVSHHRLLHLGLQNTPCRSTLSDANKRRPEAFFEALFHRLHALHRGGLPDSLPKHKRMLERLFIMDSTTISLFTDALHGVGRHPKTGRKKGGAKAHVLMRAQDDAPCFVRITEGKVNDKHMLRHVSLPPGSIIVLDKGYLNYAHYQGWSDGQVTFITRLNENAVVRVDRERDLTENQRKLGVLADQEVVLANTSNTATTPLQARLVTFHDQEKHRDFVFLTNDFSHAPATIAALYKRRWQVELLFKRLKQGYPLRAFLGESPNAIKIQIWCALIADLLVKVIKDKVEHATSRRWAFSNITSIIRQHLGTYVDLVRFLCDPDKALLHYRPPSLGPSQLRLAFA